MEKTFFILKPDTISRGLENKILNLMIREGFYIETTRKIIASPEKLREHYSHIVNQPFYKDVEAYMTSNEIVIGVAKKDNAVEHLRTLMGATNPDEAEENTIRALYGQVIDGKIYNVIHGSDSHEAVKKEISIWFN